MHIRNCITLTAVVVDRCLSMWAIQVYWQYRQAQTKKLGDSSLSRALIPLGSRRQQHLARRRVRSVIHQSETIIIGWAIINVCYQWPKSIPIAILWHRPALGSLSRAHPWTTAIRMRALSSSYRRSVQEAKQKIIFGQFPSNGCTRGECNCSVVTKSMFGGSDKWILIIICSRLMFR